MMASALLQGVCGPSDVSSRVSSPVPFRHASHTHALTPRRGRRALRHSVARPSTVQAHATEAPAKSKARPGEKKGAEHTLESSSSSDWAAASPTLGNRVLSSRSLLQLSPLQSFCHSDTICRLRGGDAVCCNEAPYKRSST